jgi:hypothetical protein
MLSPASRTSRPSFPTVNWHVRTCWPGRLLAAPFPPPGHCHASPSPWAPCPASTGSTRPSFKAQLKHLPLRSHLAGRALPSCPCPWHFLFACPILPQTMAPVSTLWPLQAAPHHQLIAILKQPLLAEPLLQVDCLLTQSGGRICSYFQMRKLRVVRGKARLWFLPYPP